MRALIPLTTWFLAIYLLTQSKTNVAALELTRHLGVCYRSARRMKHKLMAAMTEREAAWRFNRRFRLEALVPRAVVAAARCPAWPERKLRGVLEFSC